MPQSHQPKKRDKKPQYPRSKAGGKKKEAERRDGMQTGGHGDIYRVLLEESGKGDFAELDDTPEYVPVPGSKEEIFVPKERGKQSTIVSMGMEIEEYMPTKHSIKPPESSSTKKNKKAMQEKRCLVFLYRDCLIGRFIYHIYIYNCLLNHEHWLWSLVSIPLRQIVSLMTVVANED